MIRRLGFHSKVVQLLMMCVKSASFSVLINDTPTGHIVPTRGLRQGDSLSPYLFLMCIEGQVSLLKDVAVSQVVTGLQICRGPPRLNLLLFADDSVIFCVADVDTNRRLQVLLKQYEDASGQQINKEKTSMVFSRNVSEDKQKEIMDLWGSTQGHQYERYLGLPPMVGKSKNHAFADIKHKVWLKLQSWKESMFSQGGREILIKAIALAIPSYTMSCFKLPSKLCTDLEKLMARFGWGQKQEERKVHWVNWTKVCDSKYYGGLGFKELGNFNMASLAKQGCRLLQDKESLFIKSIVPNTSLKEICWMLLLV
ncbi:hypothetical protein F2P56_024537 [Juglans regia]|uniref:Reverse transcriptase domain-containing protein n=1 Tax=Juglans regia TaxID=51240 RepID=A0A833T985_JUGRE|nr:hypothetical protein F2P56_024537 [Juglans regia]